MNQEIDRLRQRKRRAQQQESLCGLTPRMQLIAVLVFILCGYQAAVARQYCLQMLCRRRRNPPAEGSADPDFPIQDWFLELPVERLHQIDCPRTVYDQRLHGEAAAFVAKHRTAEWIRKQNFRCHAAPSSLGVIGRYVREAGAAGLTESVERLSSSAAGRDGRMGRPGRYARAWCQKFRHQFGFALRTLKAKEHLSAGEARAKACGQDNKLGPILEPQDA